MKNVEYSFKDGKGESVSEELALKDIIRWMLMVEMPTSKAFNWNQFLEEKDPPTATFWSHEMAPRKK